MYVAIFRHKLLTKTQEIFLRICRAKNIISMYVTGHSMYVCMSKVPEFPGQYTVKYR